MTKQQNIPSGYNPDSYRDSPLGPIPNDWEVKELSEITEKIGDGLHGTPEYVNSSIYYFINGNNIKAGSIIINTDTKCVSEEEYEKHRKELKYKTLLLSINGTIGNIAFYRNENIVLGKSAAYINCDDKNVDFLYYYLQSSFVQDFFEGELTGSTIRNLSLKSIREIPVKLPPLPEQRAIAACLCTWDNAITKVQALLAQKELRKKWLMQNLLTGKKRLKGFSGEWEEYHLGSLGETYTGLTGKSKEDFGKGKPYIPYLNIFNNAKIDITYFDFVAINENDNQNKVQYGDIFFTVSSETPDEVGMASVMLDEIEELYLNSFCFGFRLHNFKTLIPEFSSYFLRADAFREEIYKLSQGATRFNLSKTNLMKLNVILPTSKEQTAIAQVLQAADKEIQLLKNKVEKLKEQKKGLMQVLLTGKKRLAVKN